MVLLFILVFGVCHQVKYANEFERAYFEKPAFKALYEKYKKAGIATTINLAMEHLIDKRNAKTRYGGTPNYDKVWQACHSCSLEPFH